MDEREGKPMGDVIRIDDARIRDHLGEMVRGTVAGEADKPSHEMRWPAEHERDVGCRGRSALRAGPI